MSPNRVTLIFVGEIKVYVYEGRHQISLACTHRQAEHIVSIVLIVEDALERSLIVDVLGLDAQQLFQFGEHRGTHGVGLGILHQGHCSCIAHNCLVRV